MQISHAFIGGQGETVDYKDAEKLIAKYPADGHKKRARYFLL